MKGKKLAIGAGVVVLLFYVINNPNGAAGDADSIIAWLESAANSIITFVGGVFN